jgi:hypothetical protein
MKELDLPQSITLIQLTEDADRLTAYERTALVILIRQMMAYHEELGRLKAIIEPKARCTAGVYTYRN